MIIKEARLAFVHLTEPRAPAPGADPKYSVRMILKKNDSQIQEIREAMKAAAQTKFGAKLPPKLTNPLRDGDELDDSGNRMHGPELEGCFFLGASSKKDDRPDVVAGKARVAATADHLRSGNYGAVKVNFFGYDIAGNRGVSAYLKGVWIIRRGDPLGNSSEPWNDDTEAEDFSAVVAKAQAAGQQDGDVF